MQDELRLVKEIQDEFAKIVAFLVWLTQKSKEKCGSPPIVVGGSAVEIYTFGRYVSGDVDLVSSREVVREILLSSGYFEEKGRFFISDELGLFVEVPDSKLTGSLEKVRIIEIPELGGELYVIGVEDLIVDRLCACLFWKSETDCELSEMLIAKYWNEIDVEYLKKRAQEEKVLDKLEVILKKSHGREAHGLEP